MSAYKDEESEVIFTFYAKSKDEKAMLYNYVSQAFEQKIVYDEINREREKQVDTYFRKISMIRALSFITDFLGTLVFIGWEQAKNRALLQVVMIKFLFKQVPRKELTRVIGELAL